MNRKFNKEVITGTCVDLSSEGKGIIKDDGRVIFVDGLFIGEKAEIETQYTRAGVYFGKVKTLIEKSKDRISPKCNVCTACGGCQFQQLSYSAQLAYKTNKVKNDLEHIANIKCDVNPCIGMENPYNYRNKIQIPVGLNRYRQIVTGFYKAMTHEIIPIEKCYIEDERASSIIKDIKRLMPDFDLRPYNEDTGEGELRHILVRTSLNRKEIMVVLVMNCYTFAGRNNFAKALVKLHPEITTIVQNINIRQTNVILGNKEEVIYGPGFIKDVLCGLIFKISSKSFYQINPSQCEKLYNLAIENAHLSKTDVVLDAYSGIGTIGLIAAKSVKEVISVEIIEDATRDAVTNARVNDVKNIRFINGDAGNYLLKAKENNQKLDVIFMDPPRTGSTERFLDAVLEILPKKIIYISCDPSTLSRDIKILSNKYSVAYVQPVDMFPQTFHVETIVLLCLKGSK